MPVLVEVLDYYYKVEGEDEPYFFSAQKGFGMPTLLEQAARDYYNVLRMSECDWPLSFAVYTLGDKLCEHGKITMKREPVFTKIG